MTTLRKTHPRRADQVGTDAGRALRYSAPSQKVIAHALGLSPSRVSRWCKGQAGVPTRFYEVVALLSSNAKAHAGRLVAGAMAVIEDVSARLDPSELRCRLITALEQETDTQAEEDRAEMRLMLAFMGDAKGEADALEAWLVPAMAELGWQLEAIALARARLAQLGRRVGP